MAFLAPQTLRASRSSLREALATSLNSGPSSSSRATRLALLPSSSSSSFASPRSSLFSTSHKRWSGSTEETKAAENDVGAEALGAKANPPAAEGAKGGSAEKEEFAKQLAEKDQLIKELKDRALYAKADLQNAQRRAQEEKAQASEYAITKFARDLTNSLDIINLALRSVPEPLRKAPAGDLPADDAKKVLAEFYDGVDLTAKSIMSMLKTHGVTQFDPTGEKFDPNEHEALFQAPIPGKEPGTVLECSKLGFKIRGRVLRAAQVGVVQG